MKYEDDQFEGLLNDSLKELREAEPRTGLEGRVLAGALGAERKPRVGWWKWAAVSALVILIVLGIAVRRGSKNEVVRQAPAQVARPNEKPMETVKVESPKPKSVVKVRNVARSQKRKPRLMAASRMPFPAPLPLTDEEKALTVLARSNPEVLVGIQEERRADSIAIPRLVIEEIGERK